MATTAATSGGGGDSSAGKVGVILPDAATSPRWEANDRPLLKAAFDAANIESDIQNANGDKSKFGTICDGMINAGVKVLLIVNLDSESGTACLKKAQAAGIKTIDYDRLTLGGGASYYVSFDNVEVGKLMGEGLQKCLTDSGKSAGNIVFINGDPTDNNAALFKAGYAGAWKPAFDSGKYKLVGDQTGNWDATKAGTAFEQIYTQNNGKIDGVVSANDTMAGGIIARLKANNLNGKVPVTGQDASVAGLQAILIGDQCMTVYKAIKKEADAASALAIALIQGKDAASIAKDKVQGHGAQDGRALRAADPGVDLQGERQGRHRRRLLEGQRHLHRRVRRRLRQRRHLLTHPVGRPAAPGRPTAPPRHRTE